MKCTCCGIKISNWKGNFMATTLCDLCYFDLYNSGSKDENDHLDVVQENIRFRSKEKRAKLSKYSWRIVCARIGQRKYGTLIRKL